MADDGHGVISRQQHAHERQIGRRRRRGFGDRATRGPEQRSRNDVAESVAWRQSDNGVRARHSGPRTRQRRCNPAFTRFAAGIHFQPQRGLQNGSERT